MSQVLAARLKAARAAMHPVVTQKDIAKKFKVTPGSVSLWESGSTEPNTDVLAELARTYNVSVDWLIGLEDRQPVKVKQTVPLFTVPVVAPQALARWKWDAVLEVLQTAVAYPPGTAAAMLVSSDALTSACPTGCYAVVSKAHEPTPGCVVLAVAGRAGEPILRKFIQEGGETLLLADDARWPTVRVNDGARVIGRVVEVTCRKRLN